MRNGADSSSIMLTATSSRYPDGEVVGRSDAAMAEIGEQRRVAGDIRSWFETSACLLFHADEKSSGSGAGSQVEQWEGGEYVPELGGREVVEPGDDGIDLGAQSGAFTKVEGRLSELDFGGDGDEAAAVSGGFLKLRLS